MAHRCSDNQGPTVLTIVASLQYKPTGMGSYIENNNYKIVNY